MVKNLINRNIRFVGSLILVILPVYINILAKVTMQNMKILIAVLSGTILILIIRWIYHKKTVKESVSNKTKVSDSLLPDTSMKEIRYDDLENNKVHYIDNPLPVPKRREHKEMDYAFEPADNDDYDMKDLTDKDFYDIE